MIIVQSYALVYIYIILFWIVYTNIIVVHNAEK